MRAKKNLFGVLVILLALLTKSVAGFYLIRKTYMAL